MTDLIIIIKQIVELLGYTTLGSMFIAIIYLLASLLRMRWKTAKEEE